MCGLIGFLILALCAYFLIIFQNDWREIFLPKRFKKRNSESLPFKKCGRLVPGDLNVIIREAADLYLESHQGVTVTFLPDLSLPQIPLDRDQIKRVLINLLDNAVAAVGEKGKIDMSTSYNPELRLITCEVVDNGHGIAPEDRSRLFEPYFSTKAAGTGLGLAIVNTIITDHQGFVRVRDNEPRGTRFVIELPAG